MMKIFAGNRDQFKVRIEKYREQKDRHEEDKDIAPEIADLHDLNKQGYHDEEAQKKQRRYAKIGVIRGEIR